MAATKTETRGRKRLLTETDILDMAVDMGLEELTMTRLANALNVGTATLYQYFTNRRELLRAAAVHSLSLGRFQFPEDTGQSWEDLAREYAQKTRRLLSENPSFIHNMQITEYGFEVHFELSERFVASMKSRGFSSENGMKLYHLMAMAGSVGAIELVRYQDFETRQESVSEFAERLFKPHGAEKYPHVSEGFAVLTYGPDEKFNMMLECIFSKFRAETAKT